MLLDTKKTVQNPQWTGGFAIETLPATKYIQKPW
jgi:hypothetical protein